MTLCVAWKDQSNIYFASDSRISNGNNYSDYGIKVIPIPVKVFSPTEEATGVTAVAFEKTYGMCFAGSFTGAYVVREFLMVVLQRLQYVPGWIDISFENICKVVYKYYKHLVTTLNLELEYDHSVDFFISGYCPARKRLMLSKFFIDYGEDFDSLDVKFSLYEQPSASDVIGTGTDVFNEILQNSGGITDGNLRILSAIKQAITSNKIPSVGGNIQFGKFDNHFEFSTYGIVDYAFDVKKHLTVKHFIAGINMNGDEFDSTDSELHFMGEFIHPFKLPII
jgi:hypothetical protein